MDATDTRFRLSKSKIAAYEHCAKRLWLQVHRRDLASIDARTLDLFRWGNRVGELARDRLPGGVMVDATPDIGAALAQTRQLIDAAYAQPMFEATFEHQDVLVRADILEPDSGGRWRLIEVKNSDQVRPYQICDIATQGWTAIGQGVRISAFVIRNVQRKVRREADLTHGTFIDTDVTWKVLGLLPRQLAIIKAARACVRGPQPMRKTGPHCTRPFACEFRDYCGAGPGRFLDELRQTRENGSQESQ